MLMVTQTVHRVRVTRHYTVFFTLYLISFRLINSQDVVSCGSAINSVNIKETDPAGIVLFRFEVRENAHVKMRLATQTSLPPLVKKIFEHALEFAPYEFNNTLNCSFSASSSINGKSFCDVKTAITLDAEGIKAKTGYSPASPASKEFILSFEFLCRDAKGMYMTNANHLIVSLVNEFSPVFKSKIVSRNFLQTDLEKGAELFDLSGQATDQDIGLDGRLSYYPVQDSNYSNLISVVSGTKKVVLKRNITLEYLKGRRQLPFRIAASDLGSPSRSSNMTLEISVFGIDDDGNGTVVVYNFTNTDFNGTTSAGESDFPTWALVTGPVGIAALLSTLVLVGCHLGWLSRQKEGKGTGSEKAAVAGEEGQKSVTGNKSGVQESEPQPDVMEDSSTAHSTGFEESGTSGVDFSTSEVSDDAESVV